jgi:hypothetical protein
MGGYVLQCSEDLDFIKERSNKKHDHTNIKPVFCFIYYKHRIILAKRRNKKEKLT